MCECNKENETISQDEEYVSDTEEMMSYLMVQEEQKRIEIQDNPYSEVSEETLDSDFYKKNMIVAETVGEIFQKLLGYGIDYNNSLAIASGLISNEATLEITKYQGQIQKDNNMI